MYRVKLTGQLPSIDTFATREQAHEFALRMKGDTDKNYILQEVRNLKMSDLIGDTDLLSLFRGNIAEFGVDEVHIEDVMHPVDEEGRPLNYEAEVTEVLRSTLDEWADYRHIKIEGLAVTGEERVDVE